MPQGPYFVVLEKMNSKDEIYFSNPVNINWEASGKVKWKEFKPEIHSLNINQLKFSDPNTLVINIGPTPVPFIHYLIIGLIILIVLIASFLFFKKKKLSTQIQV
jgi:hypothetical protein